MKKMRILGKMMLLMMMMMTLYSTQEDLSPSITRKKRSLEDFNQWVSCVFKEPEKFLVNNTN